MYYTESHEWIKIEDTVGTVGISAFAQKELGEVVFIELPKLNAEIQAGEQIAVLESTKAAADIYSPVSGVIKEVNTSLIDHPEYINTSPEDQGWIYKMKVSHLDELKTLFTQEQYLSKF